MYIDAAYCYRRGIMLSRSICEYNTIVSPAKMAEPIEVSLGCGLRCAEGTMCCMGIKIPHAQGQF